MYSLCCKDSLSPIHGSLHTSSVPFFLNLVRSHRCASKNNHISLDFHEIVEKTRAYDLHPKPKSLRCNTAKSIEPTGFFYHEGRCGSTLVSNSAIALDPEKTRVYSEPRPLLEALLSCDKSRVHCNVEKAANLFRDVVYMMGRTSNPKEERLFFKLLPTSVLAMDVVKIAYPDIPWIFIYRDPVQVMVSNLRDPRGRHGPGPYCTAGQKHGEVDEYTADLVSKAGKAITNVTVTEYCAAHLVRFNGLCYR